MIVVADNSPISVLLSIDCTHLLQVLFEKIYITPQVVTEMRNYVDFGEATDFFLKNDWVAIISPKNETVIAELQKVLDLGEASSIVLAQELFADILLIDERKGRSVAQSLGINITGVVGILLRAKTQGLIQSLQEKLDLAKKNNNFRLSDKIYQEALRLAGEL